MFEIVQAVTIGCPDLACRPRGDSIRLNLVADIADDHRFAIRGPAQFAVKAAGDAYIRAVAALFLALIRAFFPVAYAFLPAMRTCEGNVKFYGGSHSQATLRPVISDA